MSAQKRIAKELSECLSSPPEGITVNVSDEDIQTWKVTLLGPPATVYANGTFELKLVLPAEYPFKAPQVNFATRIWHPNVTNDEVGAICLAMLKTENWKPASKIKNVLEAVRQLLVEPQPDDPLEARIADDYKNNRAEFDKQVRDYVKRFAAK